MRIIPRGSIALPVANGEILDGTIVRPLRSVNPDQMEYSGLVKIADDEEYEFGIMGLNNKRELLQVGDPVQLQVSGERHKVVILFTNGIFDSNCEEMHE